MKLKSIKIQNYKSIKDITVPFMYYGNGKDKSATTIFAGVNESGKSNILEAIKLISNGFDGYDFQDICNKSAQEKKENKYVDLWLTLEVEDQDFYRNVLIEKMPNLKSLIKTCTINKVIKNIYLTSENYAGIEYKVEIAPIKDYYKYVITTTSKTVNNKTVKTSEIDLLKTKNDISDQIKKNNAEKFLLENQKLLYEAYLTSEISEILSSSFDNNIPKVVFWKASSKYLINEPISLKKFKEAPSTSIPLKNIFHIYGKTTNEQIKETIDKALATPSKKAQLIDSLSDFLTKHINKIWKEHKINLRINIDGDLFIIHVEDKCNKYEYFTMNQRSDGFQQFVSLILSLSAETESEILKNYIVLLDEPEVHLHPSGIRFMRDEILKIGKRNNVFVSTHSHYMIDTKTIDRHWIVEKGKETSISQLNPTENITDDEVLSKAFGLNLLKELLPKKIILVEGVDDKIILNGLLKKHFEQISYSIKSAGGASKVYSVASLMAEENIPAIIILDDDREGRKTKSEILTKLKTHFNSSTIYTLRDIVGEINAYSTIEDIIPLEIIESTFKDSFQKDFNFINDKTVVDQLKSQEETLNGKDNKPNLEKFKMKLANNFNEKFITQNANFITGSITEKFSAKFINIIKNDIV